MRHIAAGWTLSPPAPPGVISSVYRLRRAAFEAILSPHRLILLIEPRSPGEVGEFSDERRVRTRMSTLAEVPPVKHKREVIDQAVIRFAGDSGDGMQITGN